MPVKDIVRVWDRGEILIENIKFLKNKTKPVKFPISDNIKDIILDLKDSNITPDLYQQLIKKIDESS